MHRLAILYTNFGIVDLMNKLAKEKLPDVEIVNIVDDSLLNDARRDGMSPDMLRRMRSYYTAAADGGASVILNSCSSVGAAVDAMADDLNIPLVKIDKPLAEQAVRYGPRVAVIATVESTLPPTTALLKQTAAEMGEEINLDTFLCDGALELYLAGDLEQHNARILDVAQEAAKDHDVIVFAQASMSVAVGAVAPNVDVPVLSSPALALDKVRELLQELGTKAHH